MVVQWFFPLSCQLFTIIDVFLPLVGWWIEGLVFKPLFATGFIMIDDIYQSPAPIYFYQKDIVGYTRWLSKVAFKYTTFEWINHHWSPLKGHCWYSQLVIISLVGGSEHFFCSIYWDCHHPNWLSYFSEGFVQPPTRKCWQIWPIMIDYDDS